MSPPLTHGRWGPKALAELIRLRDVERLTWLQIDTRLHRKRGCSAARYEYEMERIERQGDPLPRRQIESNAFLNPRVVSILRQESALRREALNRRDITAIVCGDPAPGYSALDGKRNARN